MKQSDIEITILEDGTVRISTSEIGQAIHASADQMLKIIAQLTGGETKITKKHSHGHHHHKHEQEQK